MSILSSCCASITVYDLFMANHWSRVRRAGSGRLTKSTPHAHPRNPTISWGCGCWITNARMRPRWKGLDSLWLQPPIATVQQVTEYKGVFRWTARDILQPLPSSLRQATCVMVYGRLAEFQLIIRWSEMWSDPTIFSTYPSTTGIAQARPS